MNVGMKRDGCCDREKHTKRRATAKAKSDSSSHTVHKLSL